MVAAKIKYLVKQEAKQDVFRPASEVVSDVLLNELTDAPCPCLVPPCPLDTGGDSSEANCLWGKLSDIPFCTQLGGDLSQNLIRIAKNLLLRRTCLLIGYLAL